MSRTVGTAITGALVLVVVSAGIAGCGSSSKTATSSATPSTATAATTIGLATDASLGQILVDPQGMTLYRNTKEKGTTIVCSGSCATTWPPVTVSAGSTPYGPAGLPGALGTVTRPDGAVQVTYKSWPLYRFAKDTKPGDANGQGVGGVWFAVSATGPADGTPTATTAPTAPATTTPATTTPETATTTTTPAAGY